MLFFLTRWKVFINLIFDVTHYIDYEHQQFRFSLQPHCDLNAQNNLSQCPLHLAVQQGYSSMVEILVDHGADVNVEDKDGDTGLHLSLTIEKIHSTSGLHQVNIYFNTSLHAIKQTCKNN